MSTTTTNPIPRGYRAEEANELEAAIRAHGIDPESPASYPIWTAWEKQNLRAALVLLTESGKGDFMDSPTLKS